MVSESLRNVKRVYQLIRMDHNFLGDETEVSELLIFNDVTEMRVSDDLAREKNRIQRLYALTNQASKKLVAPLNESLSTLKKLVCD
jgi:DNA primase catalytic subunit